MHVCNTVFGEFLTPDVFARKYINNPYGASYIAVVYCDGEAVAADALWRNDVGGIEAYQSVDTAVLPEHRGHGLMRLTTDSLIKRISPEKFYGYPNSQSLPRYIKMGFRVAQYNKKLLLGWLSGHQTWIDSTYARWWLQPCDGIYHLRHLGQYLIVRKSSKRYSCLVLGRTDKETAGIFPKLSKKILRYYRYLPAKGHSEIGLIPVITPAGLEAPLWKMDAIDSI